MKEIQSNSNPLFLENGFFSPQGQAETENLRKEIQRLLAAGRNTNEVRILGSLLQNVIGNEVSKYSQGK